MEHLGQVDASSTIQIYFTTHTGSGAAVAPSSAFEAADVRIYKDGSATQRTSEAGYTMTSPFDSITGLHLLAVDLSDNTDAGFYAAGSRYAVVLSPDETVDGKAVVRVLADFKIGPVPANTTQFAGTAITSAAGIPEVKVASLANNALTAAAINADAITAAKVAADVGTEIGTAVWATTTRELTHLDEDNTTIDINGVAVGSVAGNVGGNVTGSVGSIAAGGIATTSFAAGAIDAAAIAANAIGASELAADAVTEIKDAVAAIAMADPTAVPAVTATLQATLSWILALSRNKVTQTSTEQKLYQDDGTTLVATSTHSDDGTTHTRGEFA